MSARDMFYPKGTSFSDADERAFAREELVFNATEDLLVMLEDLDVSKAELARRLGKSKSYISQVLSGSRNMTLGSFSDICFALGFKPEIKIPVKPIEHNNLGWTNVTKHSFAKRESLERPKQIYLAHDQGWSKLQLEVA